MIIDRDIRAATAWQLRPLMRTVTAFAEGVTPVTTWWKRPLTAAQLRADPFKDPCTAMQLGMGRRFRLPETAYPPSMRR